MVLIKVVVILAALFFGLSEAQQHPPVEDVPNRTPETTTKPSEGEEEGEVSPYRVNVVIVIMNQNHTAHIKRAQSMASLLLNQGTKELRRQFRVTLLHPDLNIAGGWTILPLAKTLVAQYEVANWFYFIHEFALISVEKLIKELVKHDAPKKALFLGRAIRDSRPTALHHYQWGDAIDGSSLEYPELSAGFLMSRHLLAHLIDSGDRTLRIPNPNHIDLPYELAKLIRDNFGYRVLLKNVTFLCGANWQNFDDPDKAAQCISETHWDHWMDSKPLPEKEICYAVKTYYDNHDTRLKILRETWAKPNGTSSPIKFYSDREDEKYRTVRVSPSIPNVERGHCEKSLYILKDFLDNDAKKGCKWVVLVDDDTLVNTERMARVLHRYSEQSVIKSAEGLDPKTGKPTGITTTDIEILAVGERRGFSFWPVVENNMNMAYEFLSGGAGMAFTRTAVAKIVDECYCNARDPDDMMIGLCMTRLGIRMIHHPLFHQGSPVHYPMDLIRYQKPVTYHSFNDLDAKVVYDFFLTPDTPKKYDVNANQVPLQPMYPPTTVPPGIVHTPKFDEYGNVPDAKTDRDAMFPEPLHHEEL